MLVIAAIAAGVRAAVVAVLAQGASGSERAARRAPSPTSSAAASTSRWPSSTSWWRWRLRAMPQLWQRGIALYYAGRYDDCRKQFEAHRTVNPDDVENAAWHFLCVARAESPARARAALLPVGPDARVPMREVLEMFRGKMTTEQVMAAAGPSLSGQFYGQPVRRACTTRPPATTRGRARRSKPPPNERFRSAGGYMHMVARVHVGRLGEALTTAHSVTNRRASCREPSQSPSAAPCWRLPPSRTLSARRRTPSGSGRSGAGRTSRASPPRPTRRSRGARPRTSPGRCRCPGAATPPRSSGATGCSSPAPCPAGVTGDGAARAARRPAAARHAPLRRAGPRPHDRQDGVGAHRARAGAARGVALRERHLGVRLADHRRPAAVRLLRVVRPLRLRHERHAAVGEGPRRQADAERVRRRAPRRCSTATRWWSYGIT